MDHKSKGTTTSSSTSTTTIRKNILNFLGTKNESNIDTDKILATMQLKALIEKMVSKPAPIGLGQFFLTEDKYLSLSPIAFQISLNRALPKSFPIALLKQQTYSCLLDGHPCLGDSNASL